MSECMSDGGIESIEKDRVDIRKMLPIGSKECLCKHSENPCVHCGYTLAIADSTERLLGRVATEDELCDFIMDALSKGETLAEVLSKEFLVLKRGEGREL